MLLSEEMLPGLCQGLGVDISNLPGDTKAEKIKALFRQMVAEDRVFDVIAGSKKQLVAFTMPVPDAIRSGRSRRTGRDETEVHSAGSL